MCAVVRRKKKIQNQYCMRDSSLVVIKYTHANTWLKNCHVYIIGI